MSAVTHRTSCPAQLTPTITVLDRGVIVRLAGKAGILEVETLTQAFAQVVARRPLLAVLDLSQLTSLSSLAIGELVRLRRDLGRWNGRVTIASCPAAIRRTLEVACLADLFPFHTTVVEALSAA
jgi:anti-anti-sigma factor